MSSLPTHIPQSCLLRHPPGRAGAVSLQMRMTKGEAWGSPAILGGGGVVLGEARRATGSGVVPEGSPPPPAHRAEIGDIAWV